jgi:phytoene dehydrogenase-like protein
VNNWPDIAADVLAPLHFPKHPFKMAGFGLDALTSATYLAKHFKTEAAKGLFAGMAAHSIQPLSNAATSAIALVLMANGHLKGWPIAKGGSKALRMPWHHTLYHLGVPLKQTPISNRSNSYHLQKPFYLILHQNSF